MGPRAAELVMGQTSALAGGHTPMHYLAVLGCAEGLDLLCGQLPPGTVLPRDESGLTPAELAVACRPLLTTEAGQALLHVSWVLGREGDEAWAGYEALRDWLARWWPSQGPNGVGLGEQPVRDGVPDDAWPSGLPSVQQLTGWRGTEGARP